MNAPAAPKKNRGPESDEYNQLKGQLVDVQLIDGVLAVGKLAWVDHYTLGVDVVKVTRERGGRHTFDPPIRRMIYKHAIIALGLNHAAAD